MTKANFLMKKIHPQLIAGSDSKLLYLFFGKKNECLKVAKKKKDMKLQLVNPKVYVGTASEIANWLPLEPLKLR